MVTRRKWREEEVRVKKAEQILEKEERVRGEKKA